jgi:iron complex transport system permease protein
VPLDLRRRLGWLLCAVALLAAALVLSLALGSRPVSLPLVWDALAGRAPEVESYVVRDLRVPRTVLGVVVGTALAVAGVLMQGVTRNPIAEPGILGVSQGAALGVGLAIALLGVRDIAGYLWFAFAGAALAAVAVYGLAGAARGGATPVRLALAGAALNAFLAAGVALIVTLHGQALEGFRFWQVGQLVSRPLSISATLLPFLLVGLVLAVVVARGMDSLALGDDVARGLGHHVGLVRVIAALAATLLTAVGVAGAGPIAFAGLAVPHVARRLVGTAHRWLLPVACLLGAVLLLVADVIGRLLFPPSEVPVAVMCALIGVPFLVVLVRRRAVAA